MLPTESGHTAQDAAGVGLASMRPSDVTDGIAHGAAHDHRERDEASMRPSDITDGIGMGLRSWTKQQAKLQ